jgi:hypothetical protein
MRGNGSPRGAMPLAGLALLPMRHEASATEDVERFDAQHLAHADVA